MAKVFSSGLEIGAPEVYYVNSGWTSTQTGTSTVDFAYDEAHTPGTGYGGGDRCFKAASAGYGAAKFSPPALATATSDGWVAFSWKATGASTAARDVWVRITNSTSHTDTAEGLMLKGKPSGTTYTLTVTCGGKSLGSTTNITNDGGWHHIGIHYKTHATTGTVVIYYDGSAIFTYNGDTRGLGDTTTWDKVTWVHGIENDKGDGTDGALTVSSPAVLNKYTYLTETTTAAASKEILVYDSTNFAVGNEIMLHQTQHATAAGTYEFNRINTITKQRSLPGSAAWFNPEGVVAHYHFDEAGKPFPDNKATDGYIDMTGNCLLWHLDQETADHSGTGNGGTVQQYSGYPSFTSRAMFGDKAYWFGGDAMDNTGRIYANNLVDAPTTNGSISCWFKHWNNNGELFALSNGTSIATDGKIRRIHISGNTLYFQGVNTWDINAFFTLVDNTWNHLVLTWEGERVKIYMNGNQVADRVITGLVAPGTTFTLGQSHGLNIVNVGFYGLIDEVAIWNRTITSTEVTAIYDNQRIPEIVTDYSGKGNHLTVVGNLTVWNNNGSLNQFGFPGKWTDSKAWRKHGKGNYGAWHLKRTAMIDMPSGNSPRTFMYWISFHNVTPNSQEYFSYGMNLVDQGMWFNLRNNNPTQWYFGFLNHDFSLPIGPTAHTWYHVVLVYDGTDPYVYINGAKYDKTMWTNNQNSDYTTVNTLAGGQMTLGTYIWPGGTFGTSAGFDMSEFVILDYALTDGEVAGIYAVQNAATTAAEAYLPVVTYDSNWVSTANMELYYKLDEPSGATAADSIIDYSGNGYHGTPTSMAMGAAGQVGTCATFGGGDINAGYNSQLAFERTDSWTIGLWMRTTTGNTSLLSNRVAVGAHPRGVLIYMVSTGEIRPHFGDGVSGSTAIYGDTPLAYNDGNWHHVVCTYDGTSANTGLGVYIDGAAVTLTGLSGGPLTGDTASTNDWLVGNSPDTPRPFVGDLDEVFIYSRVLSAAEIQTIYRVQSDNYHTIGLTKGLKTPFYSGTFDTAAPNGVVSQMVKVPNYTSLTVDAGIAVTPDAWDGYKGGIVALKATGTATITGNIDADGKGYRGGAGTSGTGYGQDRGYQGESIKGKGVLSPTANDGGGSGTTSTGNQNSGGGGGGYTTAGGIGAGDPSVGVQPDVPGGTVIGSADLGKLHLGSGGGGGGHYGSDGSLTTGGDGGGAVYLAAETITVAGTVKATGGDGEVSGHHHSSNSGGGAGGSVYLAANTVTAGSSLVTAAGGAVNGAGNVTTSGQGGAGSAGRIRTNYANTTGTTDPTAYADAVPAAMTDQFDHLVIFDAPSDPGNSKMFIQGVRPNATFDAGAFVVDGNHLSSDWFDMTGCAALYHLDETSGTVVTDSSGNGNNATSYAGTTVGVTGKVGPSPKGYDLNGSGGYVGVDLAGDGPTANGTIQCWFKADSAPAGAQIFLYGTSAGGNGLWRGLTINGAGQLGFHGYNADAWNLQAISTGIWYHLALTWENTTAVKIYLDGVQFCTSTFSLGTPGSAFRVGRRFDGSWPFDGSIDEVAVFSRALSAAEVKSIYDYQAPAPLAFPDNGALDAYVSMANNELLLHGDSVGAVDSSGNNRNGTPVNLTQSTGYVGSNAFSFNGTSSHIDLGAFFRFTTESFSYSLWVKPGATQQPYAQILNCGNMGNYGYGIAMDGASSSGTSYGCYLGGGGSGYSLPLYTLTTGVWQHLVFVKDSTTATIYVNGSVVSTGAAPATIAHVATGGQGLSNPGLWIGQGSYWHISANHFQGDVDEVACWTRALTQAEVTAIYNNQLPVGNPRLHQAIDDTGDLTTTSKIIAPSATSCKFGMEGATDINAAWAPGTIIAVDAVAAVTGDGAISAAKIDIGGVGGSEAAGSTTVISPNPRLVTATISVDPDGAGAITTAILDGLTTKVTVS